MQAIQKKIIIVVLFFFVITSYLSFMSFYRVRPAIAGVNSFVSAGLNGANSVSNSGGAGVFHTQGENIYALGYSNVRFNTAGQSLQLFTITPPNFSIGCSGISAEWGAFAMLGSELMQVLQSIIQSGAVLIFAFNMVLGVLCKQCQTIMTQIEGIANKLNGLNFNSCQTAEAMGNLAGAELGNMINKTGVAGATNAFADQVSNTLGNVSNAVGNFSNTVNGAMNCASTQAGAQALVTSGFTSCGAQAVANQFQAGSLLRYSLSQAHIGLIAGSKPGSGGANNLIGVLRGQFVGDLVGYPSASKGGDFVVRYVPPAQVLTAGTSSQVLSNVFTMMMNGSQNLSSMTINYPATGSNPVTGVSLAGIESLTPKCFPGFIFYYNYYLQQIESSYFGTPEPSSADTTCPSDPAASLTQQQMDNFVTNSSMPVILILKLAYVTQDPNLIYSAANAMAAGYAKNLFGDMIQAVTKNVMAAKNIDKKHKLKLYEEYIHQITPIQRELNTQYEEDITLLNTQTKNIEAYQNVNKQVTSALSQYGLAGAYNFNP